ncbi:hypothetical protein PIB30_035944 [Stylosanthes scabra]|uniref:Uncharacterized protein n=1 Tax=Stylosanthes scabra TaxID=79078 RepID=A0ABU6ZA46_9FABA|nr:hypothetical protein [Stylosanthes scabra]
MSFSWALRNGVARAHRLGHTGAPPTKTSILRKEGRRRAILRARMQVHVLENRRSNVYNGDLESLRCVASIFYEYEDLGKNACE